MAHLYIPPGYDTVRRAIFYVLFRFRREGVVEVCASLDLKADFEKLSFGREFDILPGQDWDKLYDSPDFKRCFNMVAEELRNALFLGDLKAWISNYEEGLEPVKRTAWADPKNADFFRSSQVENRIAFVKVKDIDLIFAPSPPSTAIPTIKLSQLRLDEAVSVIADGNTAEPKLRVSVAAHLGVNSIPKEMWRDALRRLPAEKKLSRGQHPKAVPSSGDQF